MQRFDDNWLKQPASVAPKRADAYARPRLGESLHALPLPHAARRVALSKQ